MSTTRVAAVATPTTDRLARGAERLLRLAGDARVGLALLLLTGAANAAAALLAGGQDLLAGPPYAILLGALALSGVGAVAVRAPGAWREWRRPGPVRPAAGVLRLVVPGATPERAADVLRDAGYRVRLDTAGARWAIHGVRRGWSRFAGMVSHVGVVVVVLGAAIGAAFGSETTFSLLPGDQALLDTPRPGFVSAVRLERLESEFGADGRPTRLDTTVSFLRDGVPVREAVLRVNEPGEFDGYLVHPWTYGPAVHLRVTTLGGATLLDAPIPLDAVSDGVPAGSTELPTAAVTLGLALTDAARNELGVSLVGRDGLVDTARLLPGDEVRVGELRVSLSGYDAWVTFLSRRDPGLGILFAGVAGLIGSLAVALWLPRRRVTVRARGDAMELLLRGERFDRPADDLADLGARLGGPR